MENITLHNKAYTFRKDIKHHKAIRASFSTLTESTFGFNLESWYQKGYWGANYLPYALLHNDEVVSNVSVNKIEFDIEGEQKIGLQIGTVMTAKEYRHQGLNRYLMQRVLKDWTNKVDFIYLFANNSVLDFYPKFNFEVIPEYQYSKKINSYLTEEVSNLDMEDDEVVQFLIDRINSSIPTSKISMRNNASLILFYCTSFMKNNVFYVEALDTIIIADYEGETLYLNDIFTNQPVDLNQLIAILSNENTNRVVLGFTPFDVSGFDKALLKGSDTFFMLKGGEAYFKNQQGMFPVLSHA